MRTHDEVRCTLSEAEEALDNAQNAIDAATTDDPGNIEEVSRLHLELAAEKRRNALACQHIRTRAQVVIHREHEHGRVGGLPLMPIDLEPSPGLGLPTA